MLINVTIYGPINFRYKLIEPPDGEWGTNTNGQYSGLIGQLQRKVNIMFVL